MLKRSLGTGEAFIVSLAVIAPTVAMSFNTGLAVRVAGRAAPLAFLIGGAIMAAVALSFVAFGRRVASAGSAYAFVEPAFGRRAGFLAGWTLLFAYVGFLAAATGLAGGFVAAGLGHFGLRVPGLWLAVATAVGVAVVATGGVEMRRVTLSMVAIELAALLAMAVLAIVVLARVPWSLAPFRPDPAFGWSGVGYGCVFAVLSLAGFEGAATLGEETRDPHRAIPVATLGSAATATGLYLLVTTALVLGYGLDATAALAADPAPLDTLSQRYLSGAFGASLDLAAGTSALGGALGSAAAAARLLLVLGRDGLAPGLGEVEARHGVPRNAVRLVGAVNLAALLLLGSWSGFQGFSGAFATLATLALIPVYMAVGVAQAKVAAADRRPFWLLVGLAGALLLAWPLGNTLYPVPPWPDALWPALVLAWVAIGVALMYLRPGLVRPRPREACRGGSDIASA